MSIMPQGGQPDHIDPTNTSSAIAPLLEIRTAPASRRDGQILADEPSEEEAAETRHVDIVELLDRAIAVGTTGTIDLGTVTPDCFESIACSLDTEDISFAGDIATVTMITPKGRFAVTVRVESDGQAAA